jgi:hypothetical protein
MSEVAEIPGGISVEDYKSQVFKTEDAPATIFVPGIGLTQAQTPVSTDVPRGTGEQNGNSQQVETKVETPVVVEQSVVPSTLDPELIKRELGFNTIEEAKAAIAEYQTLKANPPKVDPVYPNEESKRYAEYLAAGKEAELRESLNARATIAGIDAMNDEQKIKLFIKMNNPLYDPEMVDAYYVRNYYFNEDSFKDDDGNIKDPMALRFAKVDVQQKLQQDTEKANQYFAQYKSKIELPAVSNPLTNDPAYQQYQQMMQQGEANQKDVEERASKIADKDAAYSFKFIDEANKLNVDAAYMPDQEVFKGAKDAMINLGDFLNKNYRAADGSPLTAKLVRDLAIIQDPNKFASEMIITGINAERRRFLMEQKNITPNGQRQFVPAPPDEIALLRQQVFS